MAKRKANGALKKITTRAKAIYKSGGSWAAAIKKSSAEYRGGKKSSPKRKAAPKRRAAPRRAATINAKPQRMNKVSGITSAKRRVVEDAKKKLANALLKRDLAKTKRAKRKIGKQVVQYRRDVKRFS